MAKKKFYVVWKGVKPGIYHSWDDCKAQISGFESALYKSFSTLEEAEKAFSGNPLYQVFYAPTDSGESGGK
ncbi:viroplasmin family protein [Proteiniphilum sp. X52]|uniref:ribonuclease H1 domain-containing protein n=1 Tax=Proteiniphilum sp. X52 TaxID=2382159 RepID=UPI00351A6D6B